VQRGRDLKAMPILLAPTFHTKSWNISAPAWNRAPVGLVIGSHNRSLKAQHDLQFANGQLASVVNAI
jgi:hypothetical protein